MTDSPLSRRQFLGATAATAAVVALPASAAEAKPSPLAPEPPPPAGVCQRLGSARFRELTSGFHFSPDSKWLAQFDGQHFVGYEVATGRRAKWTLPQKFDLFYLYLSNAALLVVDINDNQKPHVFDQDTGRERALHQLRKSDHYALAPDGTGLIQHDGVELWHTDLRTGKTVWSRKWQCDASVPAVLYPVTGRWLVAVGVKRLHLFDPLTGKDGPRLEDAAPKDAAPDNHFTLVGVSADGKRIAGRHTAEPPEWIVVWDLTNGKVVGRLSPPEGLFEYALTADGQHLLRIDTTGRLVGMSVRTGTVTRKLAATNVGSLLLSPDGKTLVCGRANEFLGAGVGGFIDESGSVIRLVNPATGELLPQSPDPSVAVRGVRFADRHAVVAEVGAASSPSAHLVWDVRTDRRRAVSCSVPSVNFAGLGGTYSNELSPDATRYIALVEGGRHSVLGGWEVCVTDGATRRRLYGLGGDIHGYPDVPFWIGGGKIGVVSGQALSVFDLTDRRWRSVPLDFQPDWRTEHAPTPDGCTVALLHPENEKEQPSPIVTWVDVKTGTTTTRRGAVGTLSVSACGNRVAVTDMPDSGNGQYDTLFVTAIDRDGWRRAFDVRTTSPPIGVRQFGLSPCGRTAFLAHEKPGEGEDAAAIPVVQFWEVLSGEKRAEFGTPFVAEGLGVSPCGRRIATTHRDAPIYLWDVFGETSDAQVKPDATTWAALDGTTDTAFTALRRLVQHPTAAVELLAAKLTPAEPPKAEWVKARIDKLGSTDFRTRHTADLELSAVADRIAEPLRKAVAAGADSPEADERLTALLAKAEGVPRSAWRAVRAVEALEYCDGKPAVELLKKLAGGVATAVLTKEAKAAVKRRV